MFLFFIQSIKLHHNKKMAAIKDYLDQKECFQKLLILRETVIYIVIRLIYLLIYIMGCASPILKYYLYIMIVFTCV